MSSSPFERWSSPQILHIWSDDAKFARWRTLWWMLACAQHDLGLKAIPKEALGELLNAKDKPIDYAKVARYEAETKHDEHACCEGHVETDEAVLELRHERGRRERRDRFPPSALQRREEADDPRADRDRERDDRGG